jgi:hypothetical protein
MFDVVSRDAVLCHRVATSFFLELVRYSEVGKSPAPPPNISKKTLMRFCLAPVPGGYHGRHYLSGRSYSRGDGDPFVSWFALVFGSGFPKEISMTNATYAEPAAVSAAARPMFFQWSSIFGGGFVAAACFFVATAFATAIGLAVSSASPTWRDTSTGLAVLSGAWIVLTAIGSFALGGYIAGRTRWTWQGTPDDIHFRDGIHGLIVWALAIVLGVALTWASASAVAPLKANTAVAAQTGGSSEPTFLTYEIDQLLRSDARPAADDPGLRAEAGRTLQRGVGRNDLSADDRDYLVRMVQARTGLSPPDAQQRVQRVLAASRDAAQQARKSAIIMGFTLAAALVAAAAAAWGAAIIGGRHRDQNVAPSLFFRRAGQIERA